jgi:prefoldin subunit 5
MEFDLNSSIDEAIEFLYERKETYEAELKDIGNDPSERQARQEIEAVLKRLNRVIEELSNYICQ